MLFALVRAAPGFFAAGRFLVLVFVTTLAFFPDDFRFAALRAGRLAAVFFAAFFPLAPFLVEAFLRAVFFRTAFFLVVFFLVFLWVFPAFAVFLRAGFFFPALLRADLAFFPDFFLVTDLARAELPRVAFFLVFLAAAFRAGIAFASKPQAQIRATGDYTQTVAQRKSSGAKFGYLSRICRPGPHGPSPPIVLTSFLLYTRAVGAVIAAWLLLDYHRTVCA